MRYYDNSYSQYHSNNHTPAQQERLETGEVDFDNVSSLEGVREAASQVPVARFKGSVGDYFLWCTCLSLIVAAVSAIIGMLSSADQVPGLGLAHGILGWTQPAFGGKTQFNLVVLGTDDKVEQGRSDTLIFAMVNVGTKRVALLSIPRDSRAEIPGCGVDKINSAYVKGGHELTQATVSRMLGRSVDYYVKTGFGGFREIVDALGGVDLEVEKRMYYRDRSQGLLINLRPGKQHLNGEKAMGYVRFRKDRLGDIGRIQRQQKFLLAVANKMMEPASLARLPAILPKIQKNVETDLSSRDLLELARLFRKVDPGSVKMATLPGAPAMIEGVSYWQLDPVEASRTLDSLTDSLSLEESDLLTVRVLNGSGASGMAKKVSGELTEKGYRVIETGNADSFGYSTSVIVCHSRHKTQQSHRLQKELGAGDVMIRPESSEKADVTVIVGRDLAAQTAHSG